MTRLLFLLVVSAVAALPQGWTTNTNTKIIDVCPANGFGGITDADSGLPYQFATNCHAITSAWTGGVVDTKRNRFIIWGGGHGDYSGNEVYALSMTGTPTMTRLTNPSPLITLNDCQAGNETSPDGTPVGRHSYYGIVYLPHVDKMMSIGGAAAPCGRLSATFKTWMFDMATNTWADRAAGTPPIESGATNGWICAYDPLTEDVLCNVPGPYNMMRYRYSTNTWTRLSGGATPTIVGYAHGAGIDPHRRLMLFMGHAVNIAPGGFKIFAVDISTGSTYQTQDWTSTSTGCTALDVDYPAITYDSARGEFALFPSFGNTMYTYNPDTRVCVPHTFTGGPPVHTGSGSAGIFNKFSYVPSAGKYISVVDASADTRTLTLDPNATSGLGPSTVTCIDRDGDGYGVGATCTGKDADDGDAAVTTGAQCITKYSTLTGCINHLGYAPTRIWYLAPGGNDGSCVSAGAPVGIGSPCLTNAPINTNLTAGDMVIYRTGTYLHAARIAPPVNGTAGAPIIYLAYPGESALLDEAPTYASNADIIDRSYIVIDGLKMTNGFSGGCISGGVGVHGLSANTFHHVIVRNVEGYIGFRGMLIQGYDNLTIENNVWHDHSTSGGEHGIYIGSKGNLLSTHAIIRRNIAYNNDYTGIQLNGNNQHAVVAQNLSYGNYTASYSWENGIHDSFFLSNVAFGWRDSGGLVISNYNGYEAPPGVFDVCGPSFNAPCTCTPTPNLGSACPHDQTGNLIENFTAWGTAVGRDTQDAAGRPPILVALQNRTVGCTDNCCTTTACLASNLGGNTYRNLALGIYGTSNYYQPIVFRDGDKNYPTTSTFNNLIGYNSDATHATDIIGYGPGVSFGNAPYTCAAAAAITTISGCLNGNPLFVSSPTTYTPASMNLRLQNTSPAKGVGTTTGLPTFDLTGALFTTSPSLGAFENTSATATSQPAISGTGKLTGAGSIR